MGILLSPIILFPLLVLPFFAYKGLALFQNIQAARKTGLPYVLSPVHELELWSYIVGGILRWRYDSYLLQDKGWPKWAQFMIKDWGYEDKGRAHKEFGDVFLVVAPGGIICYIADAKVAMDVCTRRKDFIKQREKMKMLEPFGPNVVTAEGNLWKFHIRHTLPPFGEAVNKLVWTEAIRQTEFLSSSWATQGSGDLKKDVYLLGLNVIACAGFGRQLDWSDDSRKIPEGHKMILIESILGVVLNLPQILLLPKWALKRSPWRLAYDAYVDFEKYMREFIQVEKEKLANNSEYEGNMRGNLLTSVLKTNTTTEERSLDSKLDRSVLNDDEVLGNIFMFLMAGYDTTANTMMYSSVILALYDNIQDEVIREIDWVYDEAKKQGRDELTYTEDFPKFRYMLAFMYEILRIFPIVIPITRMVDEDQKIFVESKDTHKGYGDSSITHILPSQCGVIVNNTGIHYSEAYWPEAHKIDPHRWLSEDPNGFKPARSSIQEEYDPNHVDTKFAIPAHVKGTFLTFSEGPRACLGRKFAQAEQIAFFARLLRRYQIRLGGNVSKAEVEQNIRLRSAGSPVTLALPDDVKLFLDPRVH